MIRILFVMSILVIGGCASIPDDLSTSPEQTLLPFAATVTSKPDNQTARWGGEIAQVSNLAQGSLIEVVEFTLNSRGRPLKADTSGGRFQVQVPGFIDPAIYAPGRMITALGSFAEIKEGLVGEQPYRFPVLHTDQVHLWPEVQESSTRDCHCDPFFLHRSFMMRPIIIVPAN
ncbi:MAG: Slp family lipoprotein [Nitrincola lacisaponensis]|uniref:Slp family lipoprotein n=1 Tax=Nitrincola lacisaponensis TaxID=267850 RepID=UPI00391B6D09